MKPHPTHAGTARSHLYRWVPSRFLALFLFTCILVLAEPVRARSQVDRLDGVVTKVRDGDTLQMRIGNGRRIEVRLNAIDAPEKAHGATRGQPHAERARLNLAHLVARRHVALLRTTMDRYGRHVGRIVVTTAGGEVDAGWWQIHSGYAWVYERYIEEIPASLRASYREAQASARTARRGLWADARPVAPWDWRMRHRSP